nr:hypothetical protein [uncultured Roseateles sp.]
MKQAPDDDQHWLDLIAGRAVPEADARTRKEAAWFRAALLSYRLGAPPGAPTAPDERAARLLTRARDAGVIATAANEPQGKFKPARRWWLAAGIAACALLLVRAPSLWTEDESHTLRAGAAMQRIETLTPMLRRDQMLQALTGAGFDAHPYERLGRPGIDVELPVPLPPIQAEALRRLGLVPPKGPALQIEFILPPESARQ